MNGFIIVLRRWANNFGAFIGSMIIEFVVEANWIFYTFSYFTVIMLILETSHRNVHAFVGHIVIYLTFRARKA